MTIHDGLARIVDEFRPDEAAVEATFVNRDAVATLKDWGVLRSGIHVQ